MKVTIATLTWLTLHTLLACKPQVQELSDSKSLDNFVAGEKITNNQCSGSYLWERMDPRVLGLIEDNMLINVPQNMTPALSQALTAVPTSLKNLFFSMLYRIDVSPGNAARCAKITGEQGSVACFEAVKEQVTDPKTKKTFEVERVALLVEAKPEDIRFGLLRAFGYLFSERFAKMKTVDGQPVVTTEDEPQFLAWKNDLAASVIHDVANSKAGFTAQTFGQFRSLLPMNHAMLGRDASLSDRNKHWLAYRTAEPDKAGQLADFLLAESADSYWCSAASKQTMRNEFSASFRLFDRELAAAISGSWDRAMAAVQGTKAPKAFGLQQDTASRCGAACQNCMGAGCASCSNCRSSSSRRLTSRGYARYRPWQPIRNIGRGAYNAARFVTTPFRRQSRGGWGWFRFRR